jgi:hypothetical protein
LGKFDCTLIPLFSVSGQHSHPMPRTFIKTLKQHKRDVYVGAILFVVSLVTFGASPVYDFSDSRYSLVVTEALLRYRSFALDRVALPRQERKDEGNYVSDGRVYQLEYVGDHLYYYLPPGSSVLSIPYVGLMDLFGLRIINPDGTYNQRHEITQQVALAGLLMAMLTAIFYFTARLVLPKFWSSIVAIGAAFGTQVWSTMSRGLWSDTWGVLLAGVVVWMLLGSATGKFRLRPVLFGTLLAWTYFVRPTNAIVIAAITIYVAIYYRSLFLRYAATGAIWFSLFVLYSWKHFGKILPNYYRASRLTFTHFGEALAGNLISPARGMLVYVPILFFVFYLLVKYRKTIVRPRLVVLALSIITLHWISSSGFPHWWGGFSYGPRLMGGTVPWFFLLAICGLEAMLKARAARETEQRSQPKVINGWRVQNAFGAMLLLVSVAMNGIGAIMPATEWWNERPTSVDQAPERLWNWRYPQFLAGFMLPPLPKVFPPADVRVDFWRQASEPYLWYGWSVGEDVYRWADGHEAAVVFSVDTLDDAELQMKLAPLIISGKIEQQRVTIRLNGQLLDSLLLQDPKPLEYSHKLPKELLQHNNILTFQMPDAKTPRSMGVNRDRRTLALAVFWLEVQTSARNTNPAAQRTVATAPLPNGGYLAEVEAIDAPTAMEPGTAANVKVKVKNVSGAVWPSGGREDSVYKVQLGNHWLDANGRMVIMDDARTPLPHDVRPGQDVELILTATAPRAPGDYTLVLDMVQERVKWFADEEESRPLRIKVAVR